MTEPTDGERAAFEAGVKFGALYHQFAGTPVSPDSVDELATAMESAIENQPFCESVSVQPREERIREAVGSEATDDGTGGGAPADVAAADASADEPTAETDPATASSYTELTGEFFDATVEVDRGGVHVRAAMETEGGYPRMRLVDVSEG